MTKPEAVLHGVLPAVLTPFNRSDGTLAMRVLKDMFEWLIKKGIHGVFIGGTTGEGLLLTVEERKRLAEEAVCIMAGRIPVGIHVGAITTHDAIDLAAHARKVGADAVASVPPFYYGYSETELRLFFIEVARAASGLPLYLYNIPAYCRNAIKPEFAQTLFETIPEVVGIKESSGHPETLLAFSKYCKTGFQLICGADEMISFALKQGAIGMVSSGAAVFPELYIELWQRAQEGNWEEAVKIQKRIKCMQTVLSDGMRISFYKEVWRIRGCDLGPPRLPHSEVTPEESKQIHEELANLGLLE